MVLVNNIRQWGHTRDIYSDRSMATLSYVSYDSHTMAHEEKKSEIHESRFFFFKKIKHEAETLGRFSHFLFLLRSHISLYTKMGNKVVRLVTFKAIV